MVVEKKPTGVFARFAAFCKSVGPKRLTIVGLCGFANFAICLGSAMQAPFFPGEAIARGASSFEYSLAYSIFNFGVLVCSPLFGKYMNSVGAKRLMLYGGLVSGITQLIFGLLHFVHGRFLFVAASIAIRLVEGIGFAAFFTASYTVVVDNFPETAATAMSIVEGCVGISTAFAPGMGGFLYKVGGFITPFEVAGVMALIPIILIVAFLPPEKLSDKSQLANSNNNNEKMETISGSLKYSTDQLAAVGFKNGGLFSTESHEVQRASFWKMIKIPYVALSMLAVAISSSGFGFFTAHLSLHVQRELSLTTEQVSLLFVLSGTVYALATVLWGYLSDHVVASRAAMTISTIVTIVAFSIIGPLPFLPFKLTIAIAAVEVSADSIGLSGQVISALNNALLESVKKGFINDSNLYGLASGMWLSAFYVGALVGPPLGGLLIDRWNFRTATIYPVSMNLVLLVILLATIAIDWPRFKKLPKKDGVNFGVDNPLSVNAERDDQEGNRSLVVKI